MADPFDAASPLDSDEARLAAEEFRALKGRINDVEFFLNGVSKGTLETVWQLDFTSSFNLTVAGNVITIDVGTTGSWTDITVTNNSNLNHIFGTDLLLTADGEVDGDFLVDGMLAAYGSLQIGTGTTIKTAGYIGTSQEYYEALGVNYQKVTYKEYTGTILSGSVGKTATDRHIIHYDAQGELALNPVTVLGSNISWTANIGSSGVAARGSVINTQSVVDIFSTDVSDGPNEYANSVCFIRANDGFANSANTLWQHDWSIHGARGGADNILTGTVQLVARLNTGAPTSGLPSNNFAAITRPLGGAQPITSGHFTFPIDIGFGVSGFSGVNDTGTLPNGYSAAATRGFEVGFQAGGVISPWMADYGLANGSRIGTGFKAKDYDTIGFHADNKWPLAGSVVAFQADSLCGNFYHVGGTYAADDHLQLGNLHIWNNAGVPYFKNGAPASAGDGTAMGGSAGVTSATGTAGQVNVSAATGPVTFSAPNVCRAYCVVDATGAFIFGGYGVSSVTRLGVGQYRVNTVSLPSGICATAIAVGAACVCYATGAATSTSVDINIVNLAGTLTDCAFSFVAASAS